MKRQGGAAVVVAMLVVALAAMVASQLLFKNHIHWRKLENAGDLGQARWVLRAADQWAAAVLLDDALQNSVDHRGEAWAQALPPVDAEGFRIEGRIIDLDGRFNVNTLVRAGQVDMAQLAVFRRLLDNLGLNPALADAIADWMDADDLTISEHGAEAGYYSGVTPPVQPVNRPIVNLNELLPVRGMNPGLLERLRPQIAALPDATPVNANTASAELLSALAPNLSLDEAHAVVAQRDRAYFRNPGDLQNALPQGRQIDLGALGVSSRFFLVTVQARHRRIVLGSQALYMRDGNNLPKLIWRAAL